MPGNTNNVDAVELNPTVAAFGLQDGISDLGHTHFIGVGGAGMSVLAEMLHERGVQVSGSDREVSAKTKRLESLGIPVVIGQAQANVEGARTVVYSSAIKPDNVEIVAAAGQGAHIVHRSDILALLMRGRRAVAVAGAHGKTTTSSLLAHILVTSGAGALADPSYAIGGSIQRPDGSVSDGGHAGAGEVLVAEADESDGSFLKYRPDIAIITHAEADHLDHYHDEEHYQAAFVEYSGHTHDRVIISIDDDGALGILQALDPAVAARAIAYGTRKIAGTKRNGAAFVSIEAEHEAAGSGEERFVLHIPDGVFSRLGDTTVPVTLHIPGLHNARNAAAAILAAVQLGMDPQVAAGAATSFIGAARRFQVRGCEKQVSVIDDYAHHPTEITALLEAARRRYPESRIHVLFQPHLFSRTAFFAHEFAQALSLADDVIVTGVYPARERQEDFPGIGASSIVDAAAGLPHDPAGKWIRAVEDMHTAAQMIVMRAHHGDVIFTIGAGDITDMVPVLLHALHAHRDSCEA
ncbi:MAG: UDP-N-acetylmuramate--L-alanine ligase [Bifidobacterium sp.]|jgi:UDP-N-acetylmuramate--alanine ligase|nr:UDP-N-acetylmuramate--L-alanine ligase [Bifidobacterium sp.]